MYDNNLKPHADPEIREFEEALMRSMEQAHNGEFAAVHTAEAITESIKKRGRPAGSTKRPATLRIDSDALELWRASGKGWQTRAAAILAKYAPKH